VVGGPYPSGEPETFVDQFDLVAVGEGEETIVRIMEHLDDRRFDEIPGLVFRRDGEIVHGTSRIRTKDMSHLPLPYRGDIPNAEYIKYWRKHWKAATTPLMSTRGCPFSLRLLPQVGVRRPVQRATRGIGCGGDARDRRAWLRPQSGCQTTCFTSNYHARTSWLSRSRRLSSR